MDFTQFSVGKTLSLANFLSLSNKELANEMKKGEYRYISCIEDNALDNENLIRCEIGSISYVLALLCKYMGAKGEFFDDLDDGFLSGECNVGEEEFEWLSQWLQDAKNVIIDSSFFAHKDSKMLFKLLSLLNLNVILADDDTKSIDTNYELSELGELENFDGSVIYKIKANELGLVGGASFAAVSKIKNGDIINLSPLNLNVEFRQDNRLKGTVGLLFLREFSGYCFELVKVRKI